MKKQLKVQKESKKNPTNETTKLSSKTDSKTKTRNTSKKGVSVREVIDKIVASLKAEAPEGSDKARNNMVKKYLEDSFSQHEISKSYNVLILYDEGRMVKSDADHIYSAATSFEERKPLLLILYSTGGVVDSAYLIGKLCREYSNEKLVIVVPRQAKSAATLICCAADEIHMGSLSELGPIDPQIDGLPALGLKNSVEHIADLVKKYPQSSGMFAKYLHLSVNPLHLGYFERVAESAVQYAERLLRPHSGNLKQSPQKIAYNLVYSYKDHSFVIDKSEATEIFGDEVIVSDSKEYKFGNSIYKKLKFISRVADIMDYYFYLIGAITSEPNFKKKSK
jgi:hypothetical protein